MEPNKPLSTVQGSKASIPWKAILHGSFTGVIYGFIGLVLYIFKLTGSPLLFFGGIFIFGRMGVWAWKRFIKPIKLQNEKSIAIFCMGAGFFTVAIAAYTLIPW